MDSFQFYLNKLAEEASEIAQIALKTAQFGAQSFDAAGTELLYDNFKILHKELDDLQAMVEELNSRHELNYVPDRKAITLKKQKVEYYKQFSVKLGYVKE